MVTKAGQALAEMKQWGDTGDVNVQPIQEEILKMFSNQLLKVTGDRLMWGRQYEPPVWDGFFANEMNEDRRSFQYGLAQDIHSFRNMAGEHVLRQTPQRVSAAQIHSELYTEAAVDLLEPDEFREVGPVPSDRVKTLESMGFSEQSEVKEFSLQERAFKDRRRQSEFKREAYGKRMELVFRFPNYKFISVESLQKVTRKYGLVVKPVNKFIGKIPDANVLEMAAFVKQLGDEVLPAHALYHQPGQYVIAAPAEEFKADLLIERDAFPRWLLDDPIVLYPALDGYLIVTAWGDEASDPEVINERQN